MLGAVRQAPLTLYSDVVHFVATPKVWRDLAQVSCHRCLCTPSGANWRLFQRLAAMLLKLPFPDIHVSSENDPVAAPLIEGL